MVLSADFRPQTATCAEYCLIKGSKVVVTKTPLSTVDLMDTVMHCQHNGTSKWYRVFLCVSVCVCVYVFARECVAIENEYVCL